MDLYIFNLTYGVKIYNFASPIITNSLTMTYSIHDIADLIITRAKAEDENASLINLKLQKLLYYVQAWSYGIRGEAFFGVSGFFRWEDGVSE